MLFKARTKAVSRGINKISRRNQIKTKGKKIIQKETGGRAKQREIKLREHIDLSK